MMLNLIISLYVRFSPSKCAIGSVFGTVTLESDSGQQGTITLRNGIG